MQKWKLGPLPKSVIAEMRFIVNGIIAGKLNHYQPSFHCGTAHCIAGWANLLHYQEVNYGIKRKSLLDLGHAVGVPEELNSVNDKHGMFKLFGVDPNITTQEKGTGLNWVLAAGRWRLTPAEQTLLFNGSLCIDAINRAVRKLARGNRVVSSKFYSGVDIVLTPAKAKTAEYTYDIAGCYDKHGDLVVLSSAAMHCIGMY